MIEQLLARRGHTYGSGILSSDHTQFIVNIPKNASSFLLDWTERFGWRANNIKPYSHEILETIIVLRDPVDRWISGISQYINTYILSVQGPNGPIFPDEHTTDFDYVMSAADFINGYNQNTERLLFDLIFQFDDHVWLQTDFFEDLCSQKNKTYFYLDNNFVEKISVYLNIDIVKQLDYNSSTSNYNMTALQDFFKNRLKLRPELEARIIKAYSKDYELINSVTFK